MKYKFLPIILFIYAILSIDSIEFPKDHSFHKDFQVEWCYFVGNLTSKTGVELGYELSFFHANIRGKRELFPVHFAIANISKKKHFTAQTLERNLGNVAVYNDSLIRSGDYKIEILGDSKFKIFAKPRNESISLELSLSVDKKEILLHGDKGYSIKSNSNQNLYSYYYSIPRLKTEGNLTINLEKFEIETGTSWMDHEWSAPISKDNSIHKTTIVSEENSWDWLCLNLSDGSDLMLFNFRKNKSAAPETFGTLRLPTGEIKTFAPNDKILLSAKGNIWKSSETNKHYPMQWEILSEDIQLTVNARFSEQEFIGFKTTGNSYWEGAIQATGSLKNSKVTGKGYLELKGY